MSGRSWEWRRHVPRRGWRLDQPLRPQDVHRRQGPRHRPRGAAQPDASATPTAGPHRRCPATSGCWRRAAWTQRRLTSKPCSHGHTTRTTRSSLRLPPISARTACWPDMRALPGPSAPPAACWRRRPSLPVRLTPLHRTPAGGEVPTARSPRLVRHGPGAARRPRSPQPGGGAARGPDRSGPTHRPKRRAPGRRDRCAQRGGLPLH